MSQSSKHIAAMSIAIILTLMVAIISIVSEKSRMASANGNVTEGNYATTTRASNGTALPNLTLIRKGYGVLTNVTITGAATGVINIYDATTSDSTLRTRAATTTIASFPASVAAGTYTFDANFNDGLLYEVTGTAPTSTITAK